MDPNFVNDASPTSWMNSKIHETVKKSRQLICDCLPPSVTKLCFSFELFIYLFIYLFNIFIYLFIYLLTYLLTYLFIYLFYFTFCANFPAIIANQHKPCTWRIMNVPWATSTVYYETNRHEIQSVKHS